MRVIAFSISELIPQLFLDTLLSLERSKSPHKRLHLARTVLEIGGKGVSDVAGIGAIRDFVTDKD